MRERAFLTLKANCVLPSFFFSRPKSFRRNVWNPQLVAAWNIALASMESMPIALYGIKTKGKGMQSTD